MGIRALSTRGVRRALAVTVVGLLGAMVASSQASAAVHVYLSHPNHSDDAKLVGKIRKAKCRVSGSRGHKEFHALGTSTNRALDLHVQIGSSAWQGFRHNYRLYVGDKETGFLGVLNADRNYDGFYSNAYVIPGTDGLRVGGIEFSNRRKKLHIASYYGPLLHHPEYGIVLAGAMRCHYRR